MDQIPTATCSLDRRSSEAPPPCELAGQASVAAGRHWFGARERRWANPRPQEDPRRRTTSKGLLPVTSWPPKHCRPCATRPAGCRWSVCHARNSAHHHDPPPSVRHPTTSSSSSLYPVLPICVSRAQTASNFGRPGAPIRHVRNEPEKGTNQRKKEKVLALSQFRPWRSCNEYINYCVLHLLWKTPWNNPTIRT
jgi:hypothetical protein